MSFIQATAATLDYPVYNSTSRSMKNVVLQATTGGRIAHEAGKKTFVRSLDSLSFSIRSGERVGLMGHNGSGKSTLLRALAGVYVPTYGKLEVQGKVVSLLDINLGLDVDATGYENIMLRGIVMGMTPAEVRAKTDEIAEFTDLGEYLDMPLRSYSSGMQMRLAFTISTCIQADVLLMDEWLAVGDAEFQGKAAKRLSELVSRSAILVIASHSVELVNSVCTRLIELSHGRIVSDRPVQRVSEKVALEA
jgi:lipopolysaccharide transport system ATP-binding protein